MTVTDARNHASAPSYRTFYEQALHYFDRPGEGRPTAAVGTRAAWTSDDLRRSEAEWCHRLTAEQLDELGAGAARAVEFGVPLTSVDERTFPTPSLDEAVARWRRELDDGLGVICLKGLPVREWGEEASRVVHWYLGHRLGVPGAQNPAGDLLGHVIDLGGPDAHVRKYQTADDITFHCDAADVVGLLCHRTAAEGGQSRIASSVTVFDRLVAERPDLVDELFEPFPIDRRGEEGPGEAPTFDVVPCRWDGERLRTFWHSDYMRSAHRHDSVAAPTERRRAALDAFDELAGSPDVFYDMWLEEGDVQLISNHSVVHARTGYVDVDDPAERRHLLRLWLSLEQR